MSDDLLFVLANVVAFTIFVSVMVLVGVWIKQNRFIPSIKSDPPGYWKRVVRYAWLALGLAFAGSIVMIMVTSK